MELLDHAVKHPESFNLWVAPIYKQARIPWRMYDTVDPRAFKRKLETELEITLHNGSILRYASGDAPDNLRGLGVDFLVVDEAAFLPVGLWENVLRATLSDRKGRAIFIGTPFGKNWFHRLFIRGQDPAFKQWESFTFPTSNNPYIDSEEIEEAERTLPHDVFQQEYLAAFLDDGAGVFRGIRDCIRGILTEPVIGERYTIGVDLAKYVDFTVIVVMDKRRHVVGFDRFNQIDWKIQKQRISEMSRKYHNAVVWLDSTGHDPIAEDLIRMGVPTRPVRFTNEIKKNLIEGLAVDIEQGRVSFPNIPELIGELDIFTFILTRAGNVTYSAPEGFHDDCVIALALANWGLRGPLVTQDDFKSAVGF